MRKDRNSEFLITAQSAARLAGKVILESLGRISKKDVGMKQASDFVTSIDRKSEQIIINTIKEKFPGHHFLAEESVKQAETGEYLWYEPDGTYRRYEQDGSYLWIIDPLDGTTNYIHEFPVFSVSIALKYLPCTPPVVQGKGEIILGVVFDPPRNEMFTAEKGKGAFLNGRALKVSRLKELKYGLVATGFPFRKKNMTDKYLGLFKKIFCRVSDIRRAGSAAIDLAYLAAGRCDGFFELGLSTWDIAAGSLLIKEAGGVISDFGGGPEYLATGNVVAGTPAVHAEILKEVKDIFKGVLDK